MGGSPQPAGMDAPSFASPEAPASNLSPSGAEVAKDVPMLRPCFRLSAGPGDWAQAKLSLPSSGRAALLKRTEAAGKSEMRHKTITTSSFPEEMKRLRDEFAVDVTLLPPGDAASLLEFGFPEAFTAAMADARRAAELEATAPSQGSNAAVGPTVPDVEHLLQNVEEIVESAGLHFLQSKFPGYKAAFGPVRTAAPLQPLEYNGASAQLARLFRGSGESTGPSSCLFSGSTVFMRACSNAPLWWGIVGAAPNGTWALFEEPMRIHVQACSDECYEGPLFLGHYVRFTDAGGHIDMQLLDQMHSTYGPAMVEDTFCLEGLECNGRARAHAVLLQCDPSLPHSWEQWLSKVAGQLQKPPYSVFYADGTVSPQWFVELLKQQMRQLWVQAPVRKHVEDCTKQREAALWRLTLQHLHKLACARLPALLAPSNGSDDDIRPKAVMSKCSLPTGPQSLSPPIELQWDEEDLSSRSYQWNLLELALREDDVEKSDQNPLEPLTLRLLLSEGVLVGPETDLELMQWYLLKEEPFKFFRSKADSSVKMFNGQKEVGVVDAPVDMLAFDEASWSLALLDCKGAIINIYTLDALHTLTTEDVTIQLEDVGVKEGDWMAFTPKGERLLIANKHSVWAFVVAQQGMVYPRHIEFRSPFSGKACVSPDGACLLVLSSVPTAPVAPPLEPSQTTASGGWGNTVEASVEGKDSAGTEADKAVGQAAVGVSKAGAKGCADISLQVDVYGLDSMEHSVSVPLSELQGAPEEWEMGCATLGAQSHLVLFHRPTASLASRILCPGPGLQGGDEWAAQEGHGNERAPGVGEGNPGGQPSIL